MSTYTYSGSIQYVTFTGSTGNYDITAYGGQGGSDGTGGTAPTGGLGAEVGGTFQLTSGERLEIVVGGQGTSTPSGLFGGSAGGGGGGGTFVFGDGTGNGSGNGSYTPLLVAGGGGGAGFIPKGGAGQSGGGVNPGAGGTYTASRGGGGGAGLNSDGAGGKYATGGSHTTFAGGSGSYNGGSGGFGGGGGGNTNNGGGGGGYSGGNGGYGIGMGAPTKGGGGGYSFDAGTVRVAMSGENADDGFVTITPSAVCFAAGTRIRTLHGADHVDVGIDALRIGDRVVTASGAARPITWVGHRALDCRRHPRPCDVMPVRIAAHALGDNRPARDLLVSPGHAICLDLAGEVLIPAVGLVNGATIEQIDVDTVTYWHVELESHDILLAENLACESYLDCGNRAFFAEADVTALDASPEARAAATAGYCRPFHPPGSRLAEVVRDQLRLRAKTLGWRLVAPAPPHDLWLEIDGVRVEPARHGLVARALLPRMAREVFLCSTFAVPGLTTGGHDQRRLGVKLAGLTIDDGLDCRREIDCGDARLVDGFYYDEDTHRWSDGRARLPTELWAGVATDFFLRIALAGPALPVWAGPASAMDASQILEPASAA